MKRVLLTAIVALTCSFGVQAQETGKEVSQITFASTDKSEDGQVTIGEIEQMASNAFLSMDSDDNARVSRPEFLEWDWGYLYLAEQKGQDKKYNAVKGVLFALRDRNGDGSIDRKEMRLSVMADFARADLNGDGSLSEQEYLTAWTPIVVLKAAKKK